MDILKGPLDRGVAYGITGIVIVNNWHGDCKSGNPAGWDGMQKGDHLKWTLWTLYLARFRGPVLLQINICGNKVAADLMKAYVQTLDNGDYVMRMPPEGFEGSPLESGGCQLEPGGCWLGAGGSSIFPQSFDRVGQAPGS